MSRAGRGRTVAGVDTYPSSLMPDRPRPVGGVHHPHNRDHPRAFETTPCQDQAMTEAIARKREELDRNLALELVRVTEAAALAAGRRGGRGDKEGGDAAAAAARRQLRNAISVHG